MNGYVPAEEVADWDNRVKVRLVGGPEAWKFRVEEVGTGRLVPVRSIRFEIDKANSDLVQIVAELILDEIDVIVAVGGKK